MKAWTGALFFCFLNLFFHFILLSHFKNILPFVNHSDKAQGILQETGIEWFIFSKTMKKMYTGTHLKVMCLRMGRRSRRKEKKGGGRVLKENFLKKMEFAIVLCGAQLASGITVGICLKSSVWGYVLTCDLCELASLEGSFFLTSFKSFTLCYPWHICKSRMYWFGGGQ